MNNTLITIFSFLFFILILYLIYFKFNNKINNNNNKFNNNKYDDITGTIKRGVVFADELNKPLETIIKIT
jgi:archaellum component FlaF (FlaF/FlaG flagellin family)